MGWCGGRGGWVGGGVVGGCAKRLGGGGSAAHLSKAGAHLCLCTKMVIFNSEQKNLKITLLILKKGMLGKCIFIENLRHPVAQIVSYFTCTVLAKKSDAYCTCQMPLYTMCTVQHLDVCEHQFCLERFDRGGQT